MVKCTGRGLVVKRPGVLSKVQMLNLVWGVGVFSLLPSQGSTGNFGRILGQISGQISERTCRNFVSNFAPFSGNFVQQKCDANILFCNAGTQALGSSGMEPRLPKVSSKACSPPISMLKAAHPTEKLWMRTSTPTGVRSALISHNQR